MNSEQKKLNKQIEDLVWEAYNNNIKYKNDPDNEAIVYFDQDFHRWKKGTKFQEFWSWCVHKYEGSLLLYSLSVTNE